MENTKISWAHHTVNLWWGCYEVNKACDNCYAKQLANRYHGPDLLWEQKGPRMYVKSAMADLKKYQERAEKEGVVYRIFINSMSDLFERSMPVVDFKHNQMKISDAVPRNFGLSEFYYDVYLQTGHLRIFFFDVVKQCPNLFFILLTKRPSNIIKMVPSSWITYPPANVIYMTSCPDQESVDTLLPQLLKVPGKRGLSIEPMIGPINLHAHICKHGGINKPEQGYSDYICEPLDNLQWVITGGESGHNARHLDYAWLCKIQAQCESADIPYFLKQDSLANTKDYKNIDHFPSAMQVRQFPEYELV